jgi:hypothetical protein
MADKADQRHEDGNEFFPIVDAKVSPTISGTIVDRLDQVLITFLSSGSP